MNTMNDKPLKQKKNLSTFFYENKLYEFSQKELSEDDRIEMKKMAANHPDAKYGIGSVLLSLEYLEKLSTVSLEVKNIDYGKLGEKTKLQHALNILFFISLTITFSISGYYVITKFLLGASN